MAPHFSTLAWKIPWTEEPGRLQSMGSWRVRRDWATSLSLFTFTHWRRKWQPTPVFLPGESQGQGSLVGCRLWGCTESDMTWSDLAAAAACWSQLVSSGNTYVDLLVMETEFYEMDEDKFPFPFWTFSSSVSSSPSLAWGITFILPLSFPKESMVSTMEVPASLLTVALWTPTSQVLCLASLNSHYKAAHHCIVTVCQAW